MTSDEKPRSFPVLPSKVLEQMVANLLRMARETPDKDLRRRAIVHIKSLRAVLKLRKRDGKY